MMRRFLATILDLFRGRATERATDGSPETDRAERQESVRRLAEERARLAEMIPYLLDFHFEDVAREYEQRIARIDVEIRALEEELKRAA